MIVDAQVRYEKLHEIGVGQGMNSIVYLAKDAQFSGDIAVKEIPKHKFVNGVADYYQEAEQLFAAQHANVVPVHYAGQLADHICVAMPFFAKGSLTDRIKNAPLSIRETLRVAQGVLSGLTRVHTVGTIHLDVKPSNVLFDNSDNPLVADFGQSRRMAAGGIVSVSEMYWRVMPPETLLSGTASIHADVYQAGLLLYRMVNGESFYDAQKALLLTPGNTEKMILRGKFPDRSAFLPHVPPRLRTAIRTALRTDPAKRYASASDFADQLARIPVECDWEVLSQPDGSCEWRAVRQGRCDIVVRLLKRAPDECDVYVYTNNAGQLRAKRQFVRKQLTLIAADGHLTDVFAELSS
jgi:serine/threonine protein kinase